MTTSPHTVAWESCLIEPRRDRALESYARRKIGIPYPTIRYFAPVPWLARATVDARPERGLLMHLDQNVADLVTLAVTQENSCRFCYAALRATLWARGMTGARIHRLEQELLRADLPAGTVAAMAFARTQARSGPAGARTAWEALGSAGFSQDEMKEIAYTAAITDFTNRAHTIPAIPVRPFERIPDQLHMRVLRPLLHRVMLKHTLRGQRTPLAHAPSPPYADIVNAYAGSPVAPFLARTLEEMWASTHLTRRCKLLMLVVVARGLGCEACRPDIGPSLRAEGLDDAALTDVLTHLDAAELEPDERRLVSFARETIWYEPALIQRKARALREHLPEPAVLEAIGVAALGNGLCRLGAAVLDRS